MQRFIIFLIKKVTIYLFDSEIMLTFAPEIKNISKDEKSEST